MKYLNIAGAVLTEQGGVTSHAAIICRELGIPTIIGIQGLLEKLKDGDVVEVDANSGFVRMLQVDSQIPQDLVIDREHLGDLSKVGGKARNLNTLREMGYHVPEYIVLANEAVERLVSQNSKENFDVLSDFVKRRLLLEPQDKIALRSSAIGEDNDEDSHAGEFHSLLDVPLPDLPKSLSEFLIANRGSARHRRYCGGVIVQRMVNAEIAGVCFTMDSIAGRADVMTIEYLPQTNKGITSGTSSPHRIIINRLTGDLSESNELAEQSPTIVLQICELARTFLELEVKFAKPLDIEWAYAKGRLYMLQVRSIVQAATRMRLAS